jgi:hypothetical protein
LSPHEPRCLVLDEDINWKLALELRRRGLRGATSNRGLNLLEKKDGALIKALAEHHEPCVLVAWDNKMHKSHAGELRHFGLTLAVIDKYAKRGDLTAEEYYREVDPSLGASDGVPGPWNGRQVQPRQVEPY